MAAILVREMDRSSRRCGWDVVLFRDVRTILARRESLQFKYGARGLGMVVIQIWGEKECELRNGEEELPDGDGMKEMKEWIFSPWFQFQATSHLGKPTPVKPNYFLWVAVGRASIGQITKIPYDHQSLH